MVEEKSPMFSNERRREMKAFPQMVSYGTCPFQVGPGIPLGEQTEQTNQKIRPRWSSKNNIL